MKKYRKRPLEIEAYQITRKLLEEILIDGKQLPKGLQTMSSSYHKDNRHVISWSGAVITIHKQVTRVVMGDWIITEKNGVNHYPCKPDIFRETYEEVSQ